MRGREFADLQAFAAIATHGSFARAAAHLRVSPSALSQTMRSLEARIGIRLLNRTTRSVALTEAGSRLLERVRPAMSELDEAVLDATRLRGRAAGTLRLNIPRMASGILGPLLGRFYEAYPEIVLDLTSDDALTDIVRERFDAGIRIGERLEKDMVALKLGGDFEMMAIATPAYLARHGVPKHPRDLLRHRCINWRWPTDGSLYRWEFERGKEVFEMSVEGPLIVSDTELALHGVLGGVGIGYLFDPRVYGLIEERRIERVLRPWSPQFAGMHLYYPSHAQLPATLRAFIDFLRSEGITRGKRGLPAKEKSRES